MSGLKAVLLVAAVPLAIGQDGPPPAPVLRRTLGEARALVAPRPFQAVALSPSGRRLAAATADGPLRVWDVAARRVLLDVPASPEARVADLLFPDEQTLLSVHADARLRAWAVEGGPAPTAEQGVDGRLGGRLWLAATGKPGEIVIGGPSLRRLEWRTGEIRAEYALPQPVAPMSALASEGDRLFSGHGGEILCWLPGARDVGDRLRVPNAAGKTTALAFHAPSGRLLSGHASGQMLEWDLRRREPRVLLSAPSGSPKAVVQVGWIRDGQEAVAQHASGELRRSGGASVRLPVCGVGAAARAGSGWAVAEARAVTPGVAQIPLPDPPLWSLLLWDVEEGRPVRFESGGHEGPVLEVAASAGGRRVVSQSSDALILWDAEAGRALGRVGDGPAAFALSASGRRLVTLSAGGARLWDAEDGRLLATWKDVPCGSAVAFTPGEDAIVLARGRSVETWSLKDGLQAGKGELGSSALRFVRHPAEMRMIAEGFRSIEVVDLNPLKKAFSIPPAPAQLFGKALSPDGRVAAACLSVPDAQYEIRLWGTSDGEELGRRAVALPPLEMSFGAGSSDVLWMLDANNKIVQWSWRAGTAEERVFPSRADVFSPTAGSGLFAASGPSLFFMDVKTGRVSAPTALPAGGLMVLRPLDGGRLLSGGYDGTVRIWEPGSP